MFQYDKIYGLLGKKLGHSFSKAYFTEKFLLNNLNYSYQNIELEDISDIISIVKENDKLKGFNITIPYKESIIPYLDDIDEVAKEVGAVNTVRVDDGKLKGFNTDVIGFRKLLEKTQRQKDIKTQSFKEALIFGSGGASKAVQYVLRQEFIPYKIVSRNVSKLGIRNEELGMSYDEIDSFDTYSLVINATPIGMYPNVEECLELPYSTVEPHNVFIDLIYNPEETLFLKNARSNGAATYNGLTMLYEQAEAAWRVWNNQ